MYLSLPVNAATSIDYVHAIYAYNRPTIMSCIQFCLNVAFLSVLIGFSDDYNSIRESFRMIQGVTRWDRKRNEHIYIYIYAYRQSNMLPIVQVIDMSKLRWFGHVMRSEEESMVR